MDFCDLRRMMPAAEEYVFYDTSGHSLKPDAVIEETVEWMRFHNRGPGIPGVGEKVGAAFEQTRARVARAVNADPEEIVLGENTTIGINVVSNGIDWTPGDNVVFSTHEHPGNRLTWYNIAQRYGVELRYIPATADYERFLENLDRAVDGRTRLVSMSHVSRRTGLRFPAAEIVRVAHQKGVPVLFDGAQGFGSVPVDVKAIDCDFYTFSGHKFILAPQGTGGMYVRRDRIDWLKPSWIGSRSQKEMDNNGHMALLDSARRFEFGTRNVADQIGFGKALEIWETIGWDRVFAQFQAYTDRLKAALQTVPGMVLCTPLPYAQSSGVVSFYIPGLDGGKLVASLTRHERILSSPIDTDEPGVSGVRISAHVFNTDEEADRLVSGLLRVQRSGYGEAAAGQSR